MSASYCKARQPADEDELMSGPRDRGNTRIAGIARKVTYDEEDVEAMPDDEMSHFSSSSASSSAMVSPEKGGGREAQKAGNRTSENNTRRNRPWAVKQHSSDDLSEGLSDDEDASPSQILDRIRRSRSRDPRSSRDLSSPPPRVMASTGDRWSQYELDAKHTRRDTVPSSPPSALESNGASLPPPPPAKHTPEPGTRMVTTALTRARESLSSVLQPAATSRRASAAKLDRCFDEDQAGDAPGINSHDRVRMEALKMLQLADQGSFSLRNTRSGGFSSRISREPGRSSSHDARFSIDEETAGDDNLLLDIVPMSGTFRSSKVADHTSKTPSSPSNMEEILIEEDDMICMQDDDDATQRSSSSSMGSNNWSSRYSVDRHIMAITGGKTSKEVLNTIDREHEVQPGERKSARNMYSASIHSQNNVGNGTKTISNFLSSLRSPAPQKEDHFTFGSHRTRDHSSGRTKSLRWNGKSLAWANISGAKLTTSSSFSNPSNKWRDVNLRDRTQSLPPVPFDREAIDEEHRRKKRKKIFLGSFVLLFLATVVGTLYGTQTPANGMMANTLSAGDSVTFYATCNVPYELDDRQRLLEDLTSIPSDADFVVHLGDVSLAQTSYCAEQVYINAASTLRNSTSPLFVLPGNNDWNDCLDPMTAFSYWKAHLNRFEEKYVNSTLPKVERQLGRDENFSFLHNGVLFIGVHVVDGHVQSESEWSSRHEQAVQWVEKNINMFDDDDFRAIVMFAHAAPGIEVDDFIWPMVNAIEKAGKPMLYMHANDGDGFKKYIPVDFTKSDKMIAVGLQNGGIAAPVKVTIDFGERPFNIEERTSS